MDGKKILLTVNVFIKVKLSLLLLLLLLLTVNNYMNGKHFISGK